MKFGTDNGAANLISDSSNVNGGSYSYFGGFYELP
jgi:hypothetical protein